MNPFYTQVARRANYRCEYCRLPERVSNTAFEVEHVRPTSLGGGDELTNLALACRSCNSFKSDAITGWDDETAADVPLFNPREQRWEEHFSVDLEAGLICGLTPCGRATVNQLGMNEPRPLVARQLWIDLRVYP